MWTAGWVQECILLGIQWFRDTAARTIKPPEGELPTQLCYDRGLLQMDGEKRLNTEEVFDAGWSVGGRGRINERVRAGSPTWHSGQRTSGRACCHRGIEKLRKREVPLKITSENNGNWGQKWKHLHVSSDTHNNYCDEKKLYFWLLRFPQKFSINF